MSDNTASSRGRSAAVVVCAVLAALLVTPAAIGYWAQRTLNDAQRYVATVSPLVDSPEVQNVIAIKVTDAIERQVDIEALLNQVFAGVVDDRPRLDRLARPLAAAINSLIDRQVREFLASDAFADLWAALNTRAQQALQRLLRGDDSGAIALQGDDVVLDLSEVIEQVKQRLVDRGLTIVSNVPVPDTDRQLVLMEASHLGQLRTIYAFADPLARWLILVVAMLCLLALVLSRDRPRMAVIIGSVVVANALLVALMLAVGRQLFVNQLAGTAFGPAGRIFYDTLLAYLERGRQVFAWLGLALIVTGWFTGSNRYATALRATITGSLENIGAALADSPAGGTGQWIAANTKWLRIAVATFGGVVLLWGNEMSPARLAWSLLLVITLLGVVQILIGAGSSSSAPNPRPRQVEDHGHG